MVSDIVLFLDNYRGQLDDTSSQPNLAFYRNQGKMQPDDMKYEDWMDRYGNDFEALEAKQYVHRSSLHLISRGYMECRPRRYV